MKIKNLIWPSFILMAPVIYAAPSAFEAERCGPLEIINDTNSTIVRDHKDCSKLWVLPPEMGIAKTGHFRRSANLGFCSEMKNIQGMTRRISKKMGQLEEKINDQTPAILKAQKKVEYAQKVLATMTSVPAIATFRELSNQKIEIEERLIELEEKLNTCVQYCDSLIANYNDLRNEKKQLNKELRQLRKENREELTKHAKAQRNLEGAQQNLDFLSDIILKVVERKKKLHDVLFGLYKNYGALEGGHIGIEYNLGWDQNVQKLEEMYPQYHFSKVATKDTRINANFIGASDKDIYYNSLPVILDYSLAGFKYLPYGEARQSSLSSVPNALQGDIRLSVIGACPFNYSNFLEDTTDDLIENTDVKSNKYSFGISMSYQYPVVYKFGLEAKYNLYKFYKKVVTSGSSGGFFSSRSWKKVSETKIDKDTFSIRWLDEAEKYTQKEKDQIRNTVKAELIARALQNMAAPAGQRPGPMATVNSYTPQPGALILAQGLNKTCGWNIYCKAGSWILKGLSGTFGSSRAEASFQSTHDSTATEIWNEENVMWRPGASSYIEL